MIKENGENEKIYTFLYCLCAGAIIGIVVEKATKKKQQLAKNKGKHVPFGPYEAFFKRPLDILLAGSALILLVLLWELQHYL